MVTTTYRAARIGRRERIPVMYADRKQHYKYIRTGVGRKLFTLIGQCIRDGGHVQFKQWWDGNDERADITLTWDTDIANAKRRKRSKRGTYQRSIAQRLLT